MKVKRDKNKYLIKISKENDKIKILYSLNYNYMFNLKDGSFYRWGKTISEDPQYSPFGCELLDIEISTNGCPNGFDPKNPNKSHCKFCYKNNTNEKATNMSFETFKTILDKMPKTLCQIAFGITGVQTNPDFIKMMEYCRQCNIIPNFTLSGIDLTDEIAEKCSKLVGAVAVSVYEQDKNICYNTVKKFIDLGIKQTNIHIMVSEETEEFVYEVLRDIQNDKRLSELNAIIFLGVKPKGRAKNYFHSLQYEKFCKLIKYCFNNKLRIGFDSCSACKFERFVRESDMNEADKKRMIQFSESCESFGLFSSYINVHGDYFPCSFAEGEGDWKEGMSVLHCVDFLDDIWFSRKLNMYRKKSLKSAVNGCRKCLIFDEIN